MKAESTIIKLPRTIMETGTDKDIEIECNLPDYLPGINRVIRTEANVLTDEVVISGNKAEVNGKAVFSLLYESDYKGKLKNEKYSVDFVQRFDVGELPAGECFAKANCRCSYVSCKALNPRRFVLKCRADIRLEVKGMQDVAVVSVEEGGGAFFKTEKREFDCYRPPIRKDFKVDEVFSLEGLTPVEEVIYAQLCFLPPEAVVSDGSVLLRSDGVLKCLYEEEGGEIKLLERSFSTSFTVDDEEINDGCNCVAEIICGNCELMKEHDNYGEYRKLVLSGTAAVCVDFIDKRSGTVPTDMYFEEYDCTSKGEKLVYEEAELLNSTKFNIDKSLEVNDLPFSVCVDTNGELNIIEAIQEENCIRVKGNCIVNILGKDENGYFTQDLCVPFEEELEARIHAKDCKIKATATLYSISGELTDAGKLKIKASGLLGGAAYNKSSVYAITEAELSKSERADEQGKCVVIYYPSAGETAWDIGKRYRINPKAITENNKDVFDKDGAVANERAVIFM